MEEREMDNGPKKLTKSATNRMICGVCAGIGDYINVDATVVRILWVIFSLAGGSRFTGIYHCCNHYA